MPKVIITYLYAIYDLELKS